MARTFNRRPMSVSGPDKNDIKNYTFNYESWKGINDSKDFLAVDQMTFSDSQNMYIDSEGLLSSRPAIKANTAVNLTAIKHYQEFRNDVKNAKLIVYLRDNGDKDQLVVEDTSYSYVYRTSTGLNKNDTPIKFIDTYDKLYIFKGDNAMQVYDKQKARFLTADAVAKLIYVPITKTFTGSVVSDGEGTNKLTTSERYLYYYSDVNGINGDAIGKTLDWDGKTISWNDNMKPFLVKDHYDIGDSTLVTVGSTGAVAWVRNNVLYYAVNGAIVYSWDVSTLVAEPAYIKRINFSPTADTILIDVTSTGALITTYVVSCLSTTEDGVLKYPQPTDIRTITNLSIETFRLYCYKFYDDCHFCLIGLENQVLVAYVKFADSDLKKIESIGTVYPLAVDMNATYMAMLYSRNDSTNSYYTVQIYAPKTATTSVRTDSYQFDLNSISTVSDTVGFAVDAYNYYAYLPYSNNYCAVRRALIGSDTAYCKTIASGVTGTIQPIVFLDNYSKVVLNNKVIDVTAVDFTTSGLTPASGSVVTTNLDGTGLQSTINVYNYYKTVDGTKHVFTRFSDDVFELYYTKQGTVQSLDVYDLLYLNNYFFAVKNKLYINEDRYDDDGEFLFYLPEKNTNEFDNVITKLHQINETTVAVFFEDEIYYTVYDGDVSTYRYYKSKLQYGLRKGADVITSDDSVTTFFATDRGIMALTYQNFIASSEQATTPISDSVFNYMRDFLKGKIVKLYKNDFWIAAYNGSDVVWILDTRNGSWWRQELASNLTDVWTKNTDPLLNMDTLCVIAKDGEYTDDGKRIEWFFQSQKLHLSALNYYKSVQAITFYGVSDDDSCLFNLDTYAYRDTIYENATKNVEYGINLIRTYLYRLHIMKLHEFQFRVYSDDTIQDRDLIKPIKLSNVSVRYRVSREVR